MLCCTPPSLPPFLSPFSHSPSLPFCFFLLHFLLSPSPPPPPPLAPSFLLFFSLHPSPPSLSLLPSLPPSQKPGIQHKRPAGASATDKVTLQLDLEMMESCHRLSRENHSPSTNLQKTISARQSAMDDSWRGEEGEREGEGEGNLESLLTFLPIPLPLVF